MIYKTIDVYGQLICLGDEIYQISSDCEFVIESFFSSQYGIGIKTTNGAVFEDSRDVAYLAKDSKDRIIKPGQLVYDNFGDLMIVTDIYNRGPEPHKGYPRVNVPYVCCMPYSIGIKAAVDESYLIDYEEHYASINVTLLEEKELEALVLDLRFNRNLIIQGRTNRAIDYPLFEDNAPVKVGDRFLYYDKTVKINEIVLKEDYCIVEFVGGSYSLQYDDRLKHGSIECTINGHLVKEDNKVYCTACISYMNDDGSCIEVEDFDKPRLCTVRDIWEKDSESNFLSVIDDSGRIFEVMSGLVIPITGPMDHSLKEIKQGDEVYVLGLSYPFEVVDASQGEGLEAIVEVAWKDKDEQNTIKIKAKYLCKGPSDIDSSLSSMSEFIKDHYNDDLGKTLLDDVEEIKQQADAINALFENLYIKSDGE